MLANKNNLKSELTANVGVLDTTISITSGEGILRENNMVACLEHYENDVCTKREIVKITAKNNDTFTVTRGFAVCIMNDQTKAQGQGSQSFVSGDFLSLYLSKELRESITQNIGTNETALQTMVGHINAPRTCINNCCLSWKGSIDVAYNSKYGGIAGFGDASDGDCVITEDTFLNVCREYNFNNLTICPNATLRFCGIGVARINVRNNFINCGTIDMRAPYIQARETQMTDCRLFGGCSVGNHCSCLSGIADEGGLFCGGCGAGGCAGGCQASDGHGGDGGGGGAHSGINGGNGMTTGCFGTGGGGGFGMGTGGKGGDGNCGGGAGGNGYYGGQGGNVRQKSRSNGGGGRGGDGVIRGGNAGGCAGSCDYTEMGNGGNAITNVYGLHLNARNIRNKCVNSRGGDGGNGGEYYWTGTSGGYTPTGGNGGNGANGGEIMVSYDCIHEQGCFDVRGGCGGCGGRIKFTNETYYRYTAPNGSDGTDGRVVFKNLNNPYIENFSLANDDVNEKILISWKDPQFKPSSTTQRKNTMIRVSTTNYPATITDGTLVVNETTKNQYETNPYSMSATDGVTYYFTAFAIAQDDTMIDVQTNSIEASFGWKPGSDTVGYWKLENDGNDYSGNSHHLTWTGTPTYEISGGTKKSVKLPGNILGRIANLSGTFTQFTFNVWCKPTSTNTWQEMFDNNYNGQNNVYFSFNGTSQESGFRDFGYQYRVGGGSGSYLNLYGRSNQNTNTRYNVCVIGNSSGVKLYVNGVNVATGTSLATIYLNSQYNSIGGRCNGPSGTLQNFFNGYMSEFIFEKIPRSETDLTKYVNNTKSKYGLS